MSLCKECKNAIDYNYSSLFSPHVKCTTCELLVHKECLPSDVVKNNLPYQCVSCFANGRREDDSELSLTDLATIYTNLAEIKKFLHTDLPEELTALEEQLASEETNMVELEGVREEYKKLQKQVIKMEESTTEREHLERVSNIELHWLPECPQEDLTQTVLQISQKVGVTVTAEDLKWVSRIPTKANNSPKPRPVLVKFYNQDLKNQLLRALRKSRGMKLEELGYPGETRTLKASENLTKAFRDTFYSARRSGQYKYVWTHNCQIFVREADNTEKVRIKSKYQMEAIVSSYAEKNE